jgi:hypothetical protein
MQTNILHEQLAYYRARAQEYDESVEATDRSATTPSGDAEVTRAMALLAQASSRRRQLHESSE